MSSIAVVAIGRNEGDRLHTCLNSAVGRVDAVVYVDSGSTDDSVAFARSIGVDVVELDLTIPFTAARARNAGVDHLLAALPDLDYVHFVDGDCEIVQGWIETARGTLDSEPEVAVACGRRRERFPEASVYNRLCDIEWDTPVGEASYCGGDALMRMTAFNKVGRFDETLIAGEEPELCCRFRLAGWKILRLDAEMTLHDAAMTRFGQLWQRTVRAGHAYAEGAARHGGPPLRHFMYDTVKVIVWGLLLPLVILGLLWPTNGWSLALLAFYPLGIARLHRFFRRTGLAPKYALLYAIFCILGRIPQAQGALKFYWTRLLRRRSSLIEYK